MERARWTREGWPIWLDFPVGVVILAGLALIFGWIGSYVFIDPVGY